MTLDQIRQVWTAVGIFIAFFALDTWLRTQGLEPIFGSRLPSEQRAASAVLGLVVTGVGSMYLLYMARLFQTRSEGRWTDRVPVAFLKRLDTGRAESRHYQRLFVTLFHVLPLLASIHFMRITLNAGYVTTSECKIARAKSQDSVAEFTLLDPVGSKRLASQGIVSDGARVLIETKRSVELCRHSVWSWPDEYQINNGARLEHCRGVTFFPVFEPLLLCGLLVAVGVFALRYAVGFRSTADESLDSTED